MNINRKIKVTGDVQGVYFRVSTMNKAVELELNGYVRNMNDGSVFIEVEGPESLVSELIEWCHRGSTGAVVEAVEVEEGSLADFEEFHIRYNA